MKNVYLNSVLISRFYLQTIQKKKNTKKNHNQSKKKVTKYKDKERRIIPFNMLKTTIITIQKLFEEAEEKIR
jgi:riboflavin transporter FmnP